MKPEDAYALQNMQQTDGWAIVEAYVRSRMEDAKNRLLTADTMEKVVRHQGEHDALNSLLAVIKQTIREGIEQDTE